MHIPGSRWLHILDHYAHEMEEVTADEKKPLDDEQHDVKEEEDLQPDPDETLMMEQSAGGCGR